MPLQTDVAPALTNDARPSWSGVTITGTISGSLADYEVVGPPVPGAVRYLVEVSVAASPPVWEAAGESAVPSIEAPKGVPDEALIRVAAAGPILRGPWQVYRTNFANAVGSITTAEFAYQEA